MDYACPQPREYPLIAPAPDQRRLLQIQAVDTRLDQIAHRERTLPEHQELQELASRQDSLRDLIITAETTESDIRRELAKAEADVEQVRSRAVRDQTRLDSGQGGHKELEALQHELGSLARRQADLEDIELAVMERLEEASAAVARLHGERDQLLAQETTLTGRRDAELAELLAERNTLAHSRIGLLAGIDAGLLALYEKVRSSSGGIGAALLRARCCQGCRLELNPQELQSIRSADLDEVVRCEECRRILVRTDESGV